jgi:cell division protein FtsN
MRRSLTKRRDGRDVGLVGRRTARSGEKQTRGPIQRQQPSKPADEQMKPNNRATEQPSHRSNAQRQANPTNPNQSQPTQTNPNPNQTQSQSIPTNPKQAQASQSKPSPNPNQSQPKPKPKPNPNPALITGETFHPRRIANCPNRRAPDRPKIQTLFRIGDALAFQVRSPAVA